VQLSASEALARLKEGNQHFASDEFLCETATSQSVRDELATGQEPFAIILGCSDSRVPAELVFDQGLGDLFVIRVAGNIVAPSLIGSVEFAATNFGTRLVVVMGHTQCGAIEATVEAMQHPEWDQSANLCSIVDRVRPAVAGVMGAGVEDPAELIKRSVRANVELSVRQLREESAVLRSLMETDGLVVVGAEYSLETGVVEFLEDGPTD